MDRHVVVSSAYMTAWDLNVGCSCQTSTDHDQNSSVYHRLKKCHPKALLLHKASDYQETIIRDIKKFKNKVRVTYCSLTCHTTRESSVCCYLIHKKTYSLYYTYLSTVVECAQIPRIHLGVIGAPICVISSLHVRATQQFRLAQARILIGVCCTPSPIDPQTFFAI